MMYLTCFFSFILLATNAPQFHCLNEQPYQAGISDFCKDLTAPSEAYRVVIIGGGVAGLVAARVLYTNYSITNITILEARDRLGGRINTIVEGDGVLEIGAQYIHDAEGGNPVFDFADEHDLYVPKDDIEAIDDEFYTQEGAELEFEMVDEFDGMMYDLVEHVYDGEVVTISYGDQLKQAFDHKVPSSDSNYALKKGFFDYKLREMSSTLGEELEKESLEEEFENQGGEGHDAEMSNGYYKILEFLADGLPNSVVQGAAKVVKIYWDIRCPDSEVSAIYNGIGAVRLSDNRLIAATHIISTLPLGVLQAGDVGFVPNLRTSSLIQATRKASSISRLGNGCLNKVFLKWSKRWWPNTTDSINVLWTRSNPSTDGVVVTNSLYKTAEEKLWYRKMSGFNSFIAQPTMLQAWIYGKWAGIVEKLPTSEVQSVLTQVIRLSAGKTYGNAIPEPIKTITTQWCTDEFSKGSYSYIDMNSHVSDIRQLAEPLPSEAKSTLLFAGEATDDENWSTVQGAWKSGVREAQRVGEIYAAIRN